MEIHVDLIQEQNALVGSLGPIRRVGMILPHHVVGQPSHGCAYAVGKLGEIQLLTMENQSRLEDGTKLHFEPDFAVVTDEPECIL